MQKIDYLVEVVVKAVVFVSAESPGEALIRAKDRVLPHGGLSDDCPILEVQTGNMEPIGGSNAAA